MECGVLVEWIGSENTKVLCPNLFICGVAAGVVFNILLNVGNGLDRSDYLKVSCNPAEQSRLFPTLKKQNVTNISKFVQQQTVPNNTHYYKFGA